MITKNISGKMSGDITGKYNNHQSSREKPNLVYQNKTREFSIIGQIVDSMKYLPDLAKVYLTIVDVVIDETNAENCSLMLLDRGTDRLFVRAAKGKHDKKSRYYDQKEYRGRGLLTSEGIAGKVAREGKSCLIVNAQKEKLFIELEKPSLEIKSLLCTPIFNKDEVIGVFNISSSHPGVFKQDDKLVLQTIANLAASTLSTSFLYEELHKLNVNLEKKVEEKTAVLRSSEQKYRALVQGANDGIFIFQDGAFKFTNKRFHEILGHSSRKPLSKNFHMVNFTSHMERYLREMGGGSDNKKSSAHFEFVVTKGNGGEVEVEVSLASIRYEGMHAIQGIVRDITSRKELERLKSNFLAMAAHELRSPTTVINGYNKLLLKQDLGPLNPQQKKVLKESKKSCDRLINFIREIMELSRIEAGKMHINIKEDGVDRCIADAIREVSTLARKKKIVLEIKLPPHDILKIPFDKNRIEQVLVNLTENAINYTPEGGKIEIIATPPSDSLIEIWVIDSGIGIPPAEREFIFDEFRAGKRPDGEEGVGLGLAICKKIVDAHGGKIWVEPAINGGSKFIFTLPLARA